MEIKLAPDFKEFLKLLNVHGVEYLLIGGYAVGYYGYPRATHDMDIWIAIHPDNAKRIVAALKEFGFDTPDLSPHLFLQDKSIVRMGVPPMKIEIVTTISGVTFEECYSYRVSDTIDGSEVCLIGLDHLKINKKITLRSNFIYLYINGLKCVSVLRAERADRESLDLRKIRAFENYCVR